jgi:hypothetical protein
MATSIFLTKPMAESVWYQNMGKQSGAVECFGTGHRYRMPNVYAANISLDADDATIGAR